MDPVWQKLRGESVLWTPHYDVRRDRLLHPQGHEVDYYVIEHPRQAAGVVAVDDAGRILLVQQWRHPVQKLMWSVPAGGMEAGETPVVAARRELQEETGHVAERVEPLVEFHPNPGTANQTFHVFVARGVKAVGGELPGEIHNSRWFPRDELLGMLDRGDIVDGLSLVGLLRFLLNEKSRA